LNDRAQRPLSSRRFLQRVQQCRPRCGENNRTTNRVPSQPAQTEPDDQAVEPSSFGLAQFVATLVAMASNFVLNNEITYRRLRYSGLGLIPAFLAFAAACSVGVLANIDAASWIYKSSEPWWIPGLAGALLSLFWNYSVSTNLIWRPRLRQNSRPLSSAASAR
jgi:putative flippase GtrA